MRRGERHEKCAGCEGEVREKMSECCYGGGKNRKKWERGLYHPKVYTNYKEMVDEADVVMIALPHDQRYECGIFLDSTTSIS